jgi:Rod binding domain-containing protein
MGATMLSSGAIAAQANIQQAREDQMLQQLKFSGVPSDDAKIEKGSKEFEAVLLSNWLQQAEQSFATVPGADSDDDQDAEGDQTGGQMMSLGVQTLAQDIAASGGIGIAKMVAKAMHAAEDKQVAEKAGVNQTGPAKGQK